MALPNFGRKNLISHVQGWCSLWIFVWKAWLQSWRRLDIRSVITWLALFGLSVAMMLAYGRVPMIWIFVFWGVLIGQVCPLRFTSDLSHWPLFRQLPYSSKQILLADLVSPVVGATGLCWLAYGLCSLLGWKTSLPFAILAPGIIACLALTAAFDILRLSKIDALMAGHSAQMGAVGLYIGLILAGIPLVLVIWLASITSTTIGLGLATLFGLFLSLGLAFLMWQLAVAQFAKMK